MLYKILHRSVAISTMAFSAVLCICALAVLQLACCAPGPADTYPKRYEQLDVDKILSNPRVLESYVNCVVDKGPCSPEAKDIKKILPEVLATSCSKCSPGLKDNLRKSIKVMREKYPSEWALVVNKYDPKKTHAKEIEAFLKS